MTHLARSRSDQFIDLLGEVTEPEPRPEPGYRRRPESDWLSEFADEDNAAADEQVLPDPPQSTQLEPERATPSSTMGPFVALAPMVLLAAVSSAIGLLTSIMRPGDLPVVRHPALTELALPQIPSAPPLANVARAAETTHPGPISSDAEPEPSAPVREARDVAPRNLPVVGSSPREIETAAVQGVLERYRAAFGTLSTAGIEDFWPGADTPALARTFDQLQSQRLDFQSCGVELSAGGRATARCRGRAAFVPKRGPVGARRTARVVVPPLARERPLDHRGRRVPIAGVRLPTGIGSNPLHLTSRNRRAELRQVHDDRQTPAFERGDISFRAIRWSRYLAVASGD